MCLTRSSVLGTIRGKRVRLDSCMKYLVEKLNQWDEVTLASCCGHDRYPPSIVARTKDGRIIEAFTGAAIPRKRKFYKLDKDGFYYIPEAVAMVAS